MNKSSGRALDFGCPAAQARRHNMSVTFRFRLLVVCAFCLFSVGLGQRLQAGQTNSAPTSSHPAEDKAGQDALNALLQIQDQLHTTQMLVKSNRVVAAAEAQRAAADLNARLQVLEQTVAAQRASEMKATQKAQRLTLVLAGAFGVAGLAALLLMAYFQWRAVTRLVELSTLHASALGLEGRGAVPRLAVGEGSAAPEGAVVQLSNGRLFNVVERLEKRILELEQLARAPLAETTVSAGNGHNGTPTALADRDECLANLLAEGQLLLNRNEPEKALECFDRALALEPKHAETLIKKADALEKLNRFEEALACYDDAIAADSSVTMAYLHKGGLFNRLSRYEEALQCYEHALHTHDQKASEQTAA